MSSAAIGIGYSLWVRLRWIAVGVSIYIAALGIAVQISPAAMYIGLVGTLALSAVVAHLLTAFTLGPADLGVRGSGFPKNMMVLPLRTRSLVGWPMLYGAGSVALIWILVSIFLLRQAGLPVPILWPAALGAAGTAWLQAIGWSPFPSPFARVPALALAITPLILFGSCAGLYLESQFVSLSIVLACLVWIFGAYLFAVQGLSRARAGSEGEWLREFLERRITRIRNRYFSVTKKLPPFGSPLTAHLWYECRRNAVVLPMMFSFVALLMMVVILQSLTDTSVRETWVFGATALSPSQLALVLMVGLFVLMCGLYSGGMGKFDVWGKEEMPAFHAIRPMTTSRYVLIKLLAAAISALLTWAIVLLMVAIWAIVEASSWNPRESIVRAALANPSFRDVAIAVAAPLAILALGYREMVNGMWQSFTGRKWFSMALGFLMMLILAMAATAGQWIYKHPDVRPQLMAWLPWILVALVIVRFAISAWILTGIRKHKLLSQSAMQNSLGGWAAGCVILFLLLCCFMTPSILLAAGVVLVLPLARVAAAPLALHYNRHR